MIKFTCNFDFSPLLFPYGQQPKGSGVDLKVPSRRLKVRAVDQKW